jgi:AraC-like DNA-binding protein
MGGIEKFLNLIMLLSGFLGLISSIVVLIYNNSKKFVNSFLVIIFLMTAFQLITKSTYNLNLLHSDFEYSKSFKLILIIKLPLFYLYLKTLTLNLKKLKAFDYAQLILPFLFFAIHIILNNNEISTISIRYLFVFLMLLYFGCYLFKMIKLLRNYSKNKEFENSIHYKTLNNWIKIIFSFFILLIIRLLIGFIYEFSTDREINGDSSNYISSILWLALFVKLFLTPEILYGFTFQEQEKLSKITEKKMVTPNFWLLKSHEIINPIDLKLYKLLSDSVQNIMEEIDKKAVSTDLFQDPNASLKTLANAINKPSSHVVFLFKYYSSVGFSEYRNRMRIEHATRLINEGFLVNNTLESLSIQVGFSSYNPFYSAFKKQVGISPNVYAKKNS